MKRPPVPRIDPKRVVQAADIQGTTHPFSGQISVGTFESSGVINAR
jgi:hypothetical protein